jgi:hypothetical protein
MSPKSPAKATSKAAAKPKAKAAAKAVAEPKAKAADKAAAKPKAKPKAKAKAKAKAAVAEAVAEPAPAVEEEHDHDHDGHDHDDDRELTEEEKAQAEADVARMAQALAALDDDTMRHVIAEMSEKSRLEVAAQLQMPRATMRLGDALIPLMRRKLQTAAPDHQLQVLFALAQHVNDQTIEALGPRSEEPTRDDLLEVLPAVIEEHGATLVTLMLAGYAASDALCQPVMRELLDTDDRFVIGPPVEIDARPELTPPAPALDKAALEAKREQRRVAKEAKRAAEMREREARAAAQVKRRQAVHEAKRKAR